MHYKDYHDVLNQDPCKVSLTSPERFVEINRRPDRSDLPKEGLAALLANPYHQTWRGILLNKSPMEIAIYPMIIHELRPKTVIELGAFNGGSAVWLADHLEMFGVDATVYAVDIDLSLLHKDAVADKRVRFIQGDCFNLESSLSSELLASLPHPWMIVEDAHVNLPGVLDYFHQYGLAPGDYLIVEDTNLLMWEYWADHWTDMDELEEGFRKMSLLRDWLMQHQSEYLIDTHYQDLYGKNGSKCWNSILKRL